LLAAAEGKPLKNLVARAGDAQAIGELLITRHGLEGGPIYQLGPELRAMSEPWLMLDFKPSFSVAQLVTKLGTVRRNFLAEAKSRWRLGEAVAAILATGGPYETAESLALAVKTWWLRLTGPRPLAEAISSSGGVSWSELDEGLMLRRIPGVFVAGEMLDWEAPTGGYLIQGCFATATRAARAALQRA
jgi:predicted flavoprotein YhiN